MKKILYILLFLPLFAFGQEEDPCFSVNDFISQTEESNPSITKNFVGGWNMFGFPCSEDIDVIDAFLSIVDKIEIVKDNNGSVYMPEYGFNGIGLLEGGEGYQIKMNTTEYGFSFCESINWPNHEGCTDCEASNFNQWANIDDGSCNYDSDGDGVSDSEEVVGCQDASACNYDVLATDEGECTYPQQGYDCNGDYLIYTHGEYNYGGIVFWVDETGQRALVASLEDLSENYSISYGCNWDYCETWALYDGWAEDCAEATCIGCGLQNTLDIALLNDSVCEYETTASQVVNLEYNGYSDWFLPSKDELQEMLYSIGMGTVNIGGLSGGYWASTNGNIYNFGLGYISNTNDLFNYNSQQPWTNKYRPIRAVGNWIQGCTNPYACNFNSEVNLVNNSLCEFSSFYGDDTYMYDCEGTPICYDENACNYYTVDYSLFSNQYSNFSACEYPESGYDCEGNFAPQVGDHVEGGIVFYIDETGEHGLVAALEDLESHYEWGCVYEDVDGADGASLGSGYQNTMDIVNQGCSTENGGITAAQAALEYESGGYSDWFLPSKDELLEMYNTIGNGGTEGNIGGFETSGWPNHYWSSSELNIGYAFGDDFSSASTIASIKSNTLMVRVIRSF
jgi:hypothetical protein